MNKLIIVVFSYLFLCFTGNIIQMDYAFADPSPLASSSGISSPLASPTVAPTPITLATPTPVDNTKTGTEATGSTQITNVASAPISISKSSHELPLCSMSLHDNCKPRPLPSKISAVLCTWSFMHWLLRGIQILLSIFGIAAGAYLAAISNSNPSEEIKSTKIGNAVKPKDVIEGFGTVEHVQEASQDTPKTILVSQAPQFFNRSWMRPLSLFMVITTSISSTFNIGHRADTYIEAWRILAIPAEKYKTGLVELPVLMLAWEQGENKLGELIPNPKLGNGTNTPPPSGANQTNDGKQAPVTPSGQPTK